MKKIVLLVAALALLAACNREGPAEKAGPLAVRTTARTLLSA